MRKLDVGIVGCGLITQVEHLPNLLALPDRFRVVGIADPSAKVRNHLGQRHSVEKFATAESLFDRKPDCVVIATPDAYHVDLVLEALKRGMHVFVEKPLCYAAADAVHVAAARDKAQRIVQVGYMKRFDPAVAALREMLTRQTGALKAITVEVVDPDFAPFVAHREVISGDDVPADLIADNHSRRTAQITEALGFAPDRKGMRGFAGPYCSSLVHDLNLVQGLLEPLGLSVGAPVGAAFFAGNTGGFAAARLTPGDALVSMSWMAVSNLAIYSERLSLVFEDRKFELRFPSPYLNHQPTELIEITSAGFALSETSHRPSYAEGFVEELKGWHDAIEGLAPVVNTVEQAGADMALFGSFGRLALGR